MKKIAVLGSTGSIGKSTLSVVDHHPDRFQIVGLAAGNNVNEMVRQAKAVRPQIISMADRESAEEVRHRVGEGIKVVYGEEGLLEVATMAEADTVVSAIVGSRGLHPTLAAIKAGKTIGLANKETLVTAGHLVIQAAIEAGVSIIPIDSEHSAIFQCLNGERKADVRKLILTASGGALRDWPQEKLVTATREEVLNHPNWSMGAKVTVDSATMMNKGLEVIEAHWLFSFPYEKIEVLIHAESIIHSMVEFQDGAVMAQLGIPDMKVPIQYALTYPERLSLPLKPLDLATIGTLQFCSPDWERYPCLRLAYEAGRSGGTMPTVLNAANEVAVERFLVGEISFTAIEAVIETVLEQHQSLANPELEVIEEVDRWARNVAKQCSAETF